MDTRTIINLPNLDRCARFTAWRRPQVFIFDTTLRDGEQAPGCSMTTSEKVRMAGKLAELGVDIMEAGFPIASTGDFEAVQAVSRDAAREGGGARALHGAGHRARGAGAGQGQDPPRIHTFLATSDIHLKYKLKKTRAQVLEEAAKAVELARKYVDDVEFSAEDGGRTEVGYLIDVSRAVVAAGAGTVNIPDTVGYAHSRGVRRVDRPGRQGARLDGGGQRPLPQRPRPGGRELAGGDPERRAPGRMHGQRHRRARGQLLARGDRDGAGDAARSARVLDRHQDDRALSRRASC